MPILDKTIAHLNHLLVASQDGELTYLDLAQRSKSPDLRHFFASRALEWPSLSETLQRQIHAYGGRANQHASLAGSLHRGWDGLKALLGAVDERAVLEEGLRVEVLARRRFEELFQEQLPPLFRRQLLDQFEILLERQAQIHALLGRWPHAARH
jgi:uncharacterized protein (TIGR02284 family)